MKTATQVKALIRNLAASKNKGTEVLLRSFMFERFLERLSSSRYQGNFIIKGGMLIAAMTGLDLRTTMDLDTTIKGLALNESQITNTIKEILLTTVDDGVSFTLMQVEEIREGGDYEGYRVTVEGLLQKTRQMLHIDITAGDVITPREIKYSYQLMFENRAINLWAYNIETILAEKHETIISRALTNTRMRDFYDIFVLSTTLTFDTTAFRLAVQKTSSQRGTTELLSKTRG